MSIAPMLTPDEQRGAAESMMLQAFLRSIEEGVAPEHEQSVLHFIRVFTDGINPTDTTGTRERFIMWLGEQEASRISSVFFTFLKNYWERCKPVRKLLPFNFDSPEYRDEIVGIIHKLIETMDNRNEGSAIWPPPRSGPCF